MFYYKEICNGEIVDELVTQKRCEVEKKIKSNNYIFSNFEVIEGVEITNDFLRGEKYE